jgi:hypothetical protein
MREVEEDELIYRDYIQKVGHELELFVCPTTKVGSFTSFFCTCGTHAAAFNYLFARHKLLQRCS